MDENRIDSGRRRWWRRVSPERSFMETVSGARRVVQLS